MRASVPRSSRRLVISAVLVLVVDLAACPGVAHALTLGAPAPSGTGGCGSCNLFQRTDGSGPSYKVPAGKWTITSWTARGGSGATGKAQLRVYRPLGGGKFKVLAESPRARFPVDTLRTRAVSIPVRGGDRIGIFTRSNVPAGFSGATGAVADGTCFVAVGDVVGPGGLCVVSPISNEQVNMQVEIVPR